MRLAWRWPRARARSRSCRPRLEAAQGAKEVTRKRLGRKRQSRTPGHQRNDPIIAIEPTATRIIGNGAREIANVAEQWKEATGDTAPLFLVGNGARRDWIDANTPTAKRVAEAFLAVNALIRKDPDLAAKYHKAIGIPDTETAAIKLLPQRLSRIFLPTWGDAEFANIDRQLAEAVKLGLLAKKPERPIYQRVTAINPR